jgi:hypothetical protein
VEFINGILNLLCLKLVKNTGFLMNAANSFGFPLFSHASFPKKSIEADGNDIIIVAATTAMSILEMHITTPLMKLMNKNDVNVVEISNYYTCLQDKLKIWSIFCI